MYPVLQRIEADARFLFALDALISIAVLAMLIWLIVWTIGHVNRWERRQDAQVRAFMQIAATLSRRNDRPGEAWADVRPEKFD